MANPNVFPPSKYLLTIGNLTYILTGLGNCQSSYTIMYRCSETLFITITLYEEGHEI